MSTQTRQEKINRLVDIYNQTRRFQKLIYGEELDMDKVNALTDAELDAILKDLEK